MPLSSNKNSSRTAKILPQFSIYSGNKPLLDLLEIQRKSFFGLLERGIVHELAKTGIFRETAKNSAFTRELELVLNPETYKLVSPNCTSKEAILKGKTYACKLYVQATLTIRSSPRRLVRETTSNPLQFIPPNGQAFATPSQGQGAEPSGPRELSLGRAEKFFLSQQGRKSSSIFSKHLRKKSNFLFQLHGCTDEVTRTRRGEKNILGTLVNNFGENSSRNGKNLSQVFMNSSTLVTFQLRKPLGLAAVPFHRPKVDDRKQAFRGKKQSFSLRGSTWSLEQIFNKTSKILSDGQWDLTGSKPSELEQLKAPTPFAFMGSEAKDQHHVSAGRSKFGTSILWTPFPLRGLTMPLDFLKNASKQAITLRYVKLKPKDSTAYISKPWKQLENFLLFGSTKPYARRILEKFHSLGNSTQWVSQKSLLKQNSTFVFPLKKTERWNRKLKETFYTEVSKAGELVDDTFGTLISTRKKTTTFLTPSPFKDPFTDIYGKNGGLYSKQPYGRRHNNTIDKKKAARSYKKNTLEVSVENTGTFLSPLGESTQNIYQQNKLFLFGKDQQRSLRNQFQYLRYLPLRYHTAPLNWIYSLFGPLKGKDSNLEKKARTGGSVDTFFTPPPAGDQEYSYELIKPITPNDNGIKKTTVPLYLSTFPFHRPKVDNWGQSINYRHSNKGIPLSFCNEKVATRNYWRYIPLSDCAEKCIHSTGLNLNFPWNKVAHIKQNGFGSTENFVKETNTDFVFKPATFIKMNAPIVNKIDLGEAQVPNAKQHKSTIKPLIPKEVTEVGDGHKGEFSLVYHYTVPTFVETPIAWNNISRRESTWPEEPRSLQIAEPVSKILWVNYKSPSVSLTFIGSPLSGKANDTMKVNKPMNAYLIPLRGKTAVDLRNRQGQRAFELGNLKGKSFGLLPPRVQSFPLRKPGLPILQSAKSVGNKGGILSSLPRPVVGISCAEETFFNRYSTHKPLTNEIDTGLAEQLRDIQDNIQILRPWIFLGELPLMTKRGHFILNGSPRVIVNQIARCPGIYFQEKRRGVGFEQEVRVSADLIPQRGPWLRIQSDWEGRFWARLKQEGRVKYATLYESFQEFEKQYNAPLVSLVTNSSSPFPKSDVLSFQERKTKEDRQKKALIRLFKNSTRYSLGKLGRLRINQRVHSNSLSESTSLLLPPSLGYPISQRKHILPGAKEQRVTPRNENVIKGPGVDDKLNAFFSDQTEFSDISRLAPVPRTKLLTVPFRSPLGERPKVDDWEMSIGLRSRQALRGKEQTSQKGWQSRQTLWGKKPNSLAPVNHENKILGSDKAFILAKSNRPANLSTVNGFAIENPSHAAFPQGGPGQSIYSRSLPKNCFHQVSLPFPWKNPIDFTYTKSVYQFLTMKKYRFDPYTLWQEEFVNQVVTYGKSEQNDDSIATASQARGADSRDFIAQNVKKNKVADTWSINLADKMSLPLGESPARFHLHKPVGIHRGSGPTFPLALVKAFAPNPLRDKGPAAGRLKEKGVKDVKTIFGPLKGKEIDRGTSDKVNRKLVDFLTTSPNEMNSLLMAEDIDAVHTSLECLLEGQGFTDDIDHLKNRLIRTSGKLLQQQFELGLHRLNEVITPLLGNLIQGQLVSSTFTNKSIPWEKDASLMQKGKPSKKIGGKSSVLKKPDPLKGKNNSHKGKANAEGSLAAQPLGEIGKKYSALAIPQGEKPVGLGKQSLYERSSSYEPFISGKSLQNTIERTIILKKENEAQNSGITQGLESPGSPKATESFRKGDANTLTQLKTPAKLTSNGLGQVLNKWREGLYAQEVEIPIDFVDTRSPYSNGRKVFRRIHFKDSATQKSGVGVGAGVTNFGNQKSNYGERFFPMTGSCSPERKANHTAFDSLAPSRVATQGSGIGPGGEQRMSAIADVATFRWLRTSKPVNTAFREFFGSNPLSQYMDQTNPLAEITHKRRLNSMGPGGIKRETAGMEVRGIHPTHYGRVCPIETPEGKNAGLVNSPTVYSRIGNGGFMETPLYQVVESQVQMKRWAFFSAQQEEDEESSLATCDSGLSRFNLLPYVPIPVQTANNPLAHFQQVERNRVGYRALSPVQTISVATALIPFLEHDDANRALMGSNMQRQAIPLLLPERPIVGTGFEPIAIIESGQALQATKIGFVSHVSASTIILHTIHSIGGALPQSVLRTKPCKLPSGTRRTYTAHTWSLNFQQWLKNSCSPKDEVIDFPLKGNVNRLVPLRGKEQASPKRKGAEQMISQRNLWGFASVTPVFVNSIGKDTEQTKKRVCLLLKPFETTSKINDDSIWTKSTDSLSPATKIHRSFGLAFSHRPLVDEKGLLSFPLRGSSMDQGSGIDATKSFYAIKLPQKRTTVLAKTDISNWGTSFPIRYAKKHKFDFMLAKLGLEMSLLPDSNEVKRDPMLGCAVSDLVNKPNAGSSTNGDSISKMYRKFFYTTIRYVDKQSGWWNRSTFLGHLQCPQTLRATILAQRAKDNFREEDSALRKPAFGDKRTQEILTNFIYPVRKRFHWMPLRKRKPDDILRSLELVIPISYAKRFCIRARSLDPMRKSIELLNFNYIGIFGLNKKTKAQKLAILLRFFPLKARLLRKPFGLAATSYPYGVPTASPLNPFIPREPGVRVISLGCLPLENKNELSTVLFKRMSFPSRGLGSPFNLVQQTGTQRGSAGRESLEISQKFHQIKNLGEGQIQHFVGFKIGHYLASGLANEESLWQVKKPSWNQHSLEDTFEFSTLSPNQLYTCGSPDSLKNKGSKPTGVIDQVNRLRTQPMDLPLKGAVDSAWLSLPAAFPFHRPKADDEMQAFRGKPITQWVTIHPKTLSLTCPYFQISKPTDLFTDQLLGAKMNMPFVESLVPGEFLANSRPTLLGSVEQLHNYGTLKANTEALGTTTFSHREPIDIPLRGTVDNSYRNLVHLKEYKEVFHVSKKISHETATRLHLCSTHSTLLLKPVEQSLQIYQRSNQETCLSQRPLVQEGDWVQKGDFVADCSASESGDLALGKNVTVAYMPWEGYNFEDAIVISDRLVADDVYTSIHIERYEIKVSKNSQGKERITNQIPSLPHRSLKHLDNSGIAQVSSWVQPGDILVGKVVELKRPLSPYERLAWELASRLSPTSPEREKWLNKVWLEDISLRLPAGVCGRVINSQVVSTEWSEKEQIAYPLEVHIYLAIKRKIQVGDKLAGRHGNKGIVSIILPRQDMPYLGDGSSVDMVLNPLGVPSRMNLGQIFECLLGLAGSQLGCNFKVTPFDEIAGGEASRSLVFLKLYQCRLIYKQQWLFTPTFPGKSKLFDGRTGEPFENWVTVGQAYMLKLIHMVDHKIHARSTGPYSLFTRQPVRGRSRRGGQRLGEMEVWAVEGFGAAYTLQEFLTIKSDDLQARSALQRGFYKQNDVTLGKIHISPGNPEAFKVLVSELQALCLHIQM